MQRFFSIPIALFLLTTGTSLYAQAQGVLVPAKDYQKMLDELEAAKKVQAGKPVSPSVCRIECTLKRTKERPLAQLTVTYQFRTVSQGQPVLLGGQHSFAVKAALDGGGPPALDAGVDGLTAIIEKPGEHTLTLTLETAIVPRGAKGDVGLEIGLPRAAITTLTLANPGGDIKAVTLGTRWPEANKPGELKAASVEPAKLAESYPLGPTDTLELAWVEPKVAPTVTEPTLDADVVVKVEDSRVETAATLKISGPTKVWDFIFPPNVELTGDDAEIVRPADAKQAWKITFKETPATLTARVRLPRATPTENKTYSIGPFLALGNVRQAGTVKLIGPPSLRLIPRPGPEVRRVEIPLVAGDESLVALLRYTLPSNPDRKPAALVDVDVRTAAGFLVVQPQQKLTLTPLGWKLRCEFRLAPVRSTVEQVVVDLPAGWRNPTFAPLDLVDDVQGGGDTAEPRTLTVRLTASQRESFELVLEALWPLTPEARMASVPLPRIPAARERDAQVSVTVPEAFEVSGTVREWDGGRVSPSAGELKRNQPHRLSGIFDAGAARADLAWQSFRAKLISDQRADVTVSERQIAVTQTSKLTFPDGAGKTVRFFGPGNAAGLRAVPPVDAVGPGEWLLHPAAGAKEATVAFQYAIPLKASERTLKWSVPLIWPEATEATTTIRVWGSGSCRPVEFEGPWREVAPEPNADRDALPALTLLGDGAPLPLTITVREADGAGGTVVDRAVYQWWISETGGVQGRARFLLRRWPANVDVVLASAAGLTATVDRTRLDPILLSPDTARLTLPEARPARPTLLLELRFALPAGAPWRITRLDPPRLQGAVFRQPGWWQILAPDGELPWTIGGDLDPVQTWRWAGLGFSPAAGASNDDLDRWLQDGVVQDGNPPAGEQAVTARQAQPGAVRLVRLPRTPTLLLIAGLVVGLGLLLSRLRGQRLAIVLAILAMTLAVVVVLSPQPASLAAFALQPALALLGLVLSVLYLVRHWLHQRELASATFVRRGTPVPMPPVTAVESPSRRSRNSTIAPEVS